MTICSRSARRTMSSGSTSTAKSGRILDKLLDPCLEPHLANHSDLEAEIGAKYLADRSRWRWPSTAEACDGSAAFAVSDCGASSHAPDGTVPPGSSERLPSASLRSVLLICAFRHACMCRVSTQITGNSASARALNSHCDSGPASNPIRLKR